MKKSKLFQNSLFCLFICFLIIFNLNTCSNFAFSKETQSSSHTKIIEKKQANATSTENSEENPDSIPEKNAYALTHINQKSFKFTFIKFGMSMLGVLISSLIIFLILKLYKKLHSKKMAKQEEKSYKNTLESPKDFKEAINIFLDKTDK